MKRELTDAQENTIKMIVRELCGYSIDEAEMIMKAVAAKIRESAIIEEAD